MKTTPKLTDTAPENAPATVRAHTRNIYNRAWNARINDEMRREALAACRAAGLDQSDFARLALRWFLDIYRAAGDRIPSDIERRVVLSHIAVVATKAQELQKLANPLVS